MYHSLALRRRKGKEEEEEEERKGRAVRVTYAWCGIDTH